MSKRELIDCLVNEYNQDLSELKTCSKNELIELYNELTDTDWLTGGNESYEDYMEHENW